MKETEPSNEVPIPALELITFTITSTPFPSMLPFLIPLPWALPVVFPDPDLSNPQNSPLPYVMYTPSAVEKNLVLLRALKKKMN